MGIASPTLYLYNYLRQHQYFNNFKRVIELGSQDIASGQEEIAYLLDALFAFKIDPDTLITAKTLYQSMGFEVYECIDADGLYDARVFDLNKNIQETYGFSEQFDLVTNHGTTEHCFNQFESWKNIHNLCALEGIMIHVLPAQGYVNHGFYNYNPSFFYNLAAANNYKLIAIYFSTYKSNDRFACSLPGLVPYSEQVVKSLCSDAGKADMGLYVVLQKMTDESFSMPYDGQYLKVNLLQNEEYLSQQEGGVVIAQDFVNEYITVGHILASQNKLDGAIEYYWQALKLDSKNAEANFYLGVAFEKKGLLSQAIESYQRAVKLEPNYAEAHYNLAQVLFAKREQDKLNKLMETCQQVLATNLDDINIYLSLAQELKQLGKLDEAIAVYRKAITLYPDRSELYLHLGNLFVGRDNFTEASLNYLDAMAVKTNFDTIKSELLDAYLKLLNKLVEFRKLDEASAICKKAMCIRPDLPELPFYLGNICGASNNIQEAINSYERALEIEPKFIEPYLPLGNAFKETQQLEKAIDLYERALAIKIDSAEIHYNLGNLFLSVRDQERAFIHYHQSNTIKFAEDRSKEIIGRMCFISLPKSGTIYIANALEKLINSCSAATSSKKLISANRPDILFKLETEEPYKESLSTLISDHAPAVPQNLFALRMVVDRLIVHVRDPRQALLSFVHYLKQTNDYRSPEYLISTQERLPPDYFSLSLTEQINWQIEKWYLPDAIEWLKGWIDADENPLFYPKILFTKQEDLATDANKFFESILNFYEIEIDRFVFPEPPHFQASKHLRKGSVDEWREVLTPEQIERCTESIPEVILKKFGWSSI